jgi:hypothetical protein
MELDDGDDYEDETPHQMELHDESPTKDSTTTPVAVGAVMTTTTTGGEDGDDGAEQQDKAPSSLVVSSTENPTTVVSSTKERQDIRETLVLEMESTSSKRSLTTERATTVEATPKEGQDNRKTLVSELESMSNKTPFASKTKSPDDDRNHDDEDASMTSFTRKEEKTSEVSESSVSGNKTPSTSKSKSASGTPSTSTALYANSNESDLPTAQPTNKITRLYTGAEKAFSGVVNKKEVIFSPSTTRMITSSPATLHKFMSQPKKFYEQLPSRILGFDGIADKIVSQELFELEASKLISTDSRHLSPFGQAFLKFYEDKAEEPGVTYPFNAFLVRIWNLFHKAFVTNELTISDLDKYIFNILYYLNELCGGDDTLEHFCNDLVKPGNCVVLAQHAKIMKTIFKEEEFTFDQSATVEGVKTCAADDDDDDTKAAVVDKKESSAMVNKKESSTRVDNKAATSSGSITVKLSEEQKREMAKKHLRNIYEKVEPKKIAEIPRLMEKYKGRELELVSKVIAKYRQKLSGNKN